METDETYKKVQKSNLTRVEQIKELHAEIKELKKKNEQLQLDHTIQLNSLNNYIFKMKKTHEEAIVILEADFNEKLVVEYGRYETLEAQTSKMREDYESKLQELSRLRDNDLRSTTEAYNKQLDERNRKIEELQVQAAQKVREHETMIQLLEDNADREIVELKTSCEKKLYDEREVNMHLRGEEIVTKKRFISFQRDNDDLKYQVYTLEQERKVLKQTITGLQWDILQLKKEMSERDSERASEKDSLIQKKEKQIYDLERRNQVLKKYKTVHNYKITELQKQVEAKDRHIEEKEKKLNIAQPLVEELMTLNAYRERQLAQLGEKLNTTKNELMSECKRKQQADTLLDRVRFDLHQASRLIQDPKKLKETIKDMYHKYCQGSSSFIKSGEEAIGFQHERMFQQKRFMRTVKSLRRQMRRDKGKRDDTSKRLDENSTLMVEINNLRQQLKDAHERIRHFEKPKVREHLHMAVQDC